MKKIPILLSLALMTWASIRAVEPFKYLEFKTNDNTAYCVEAEGTVISSANGVLSVENASGQKLELNPSTLLYMQFTDNPAFIKEITTNLSAGIRVYDFEGRFLGVFDSLEEAINTLEEGMFIIKNKEGQTVKIMRGR